MTNQWEVVVGNVGTVYSGTNGFKAKQHYSEYVQMSKADYGRASGEPVTLFKNGEIHKEYFGTLGEDDEDDR